MGTVFHFLKTVVRFKNRRHRLFVNLFHKLLLVVIVNNFDLIGELLHLVKEHRSFGGLSSHVGVRSTDARVGRVRDSSE